MSDKKTYTLFAGVNGAGKSTFYKQLYDDAASKNLGIRINTDEIVRSHFNNDWKNENAQIVAGRMAVKMIKDCLKGDMSFNQETTLTGKTIISNIKKAKSNGFNINLVYVGLESAELSIARVAARVKKGGHGISEEDLLRRYSTSFDNLKLVLPFCDKVVIFDNSKDNSFDISKPLLTVIDGEIVILDKKCPLYMWNVLEDYVSGFESLSRN